jgi:hypothetical protein
MRALVVLILIFACPGCYTLRALEGIDAARGWRHGCGVPPVAVELSGSGEAFHVHVLYADGSRRVGSWHPFHEGARALRDEGSSPFETVARVTSSSGPVLLCEVARDGATFRRRLVWSGGVAVEIVDEPVLSGWARTDTFSVPRRHRWTRHPDDERALDAVLWSLALPLALSLDLAVVGVATATLILWAPFIDSPAAHDVWRVFPGFNGDDPWLASDDD